MFALCFGQLTALPTAAGEPAAPASPAMAAQERRLIGDTLAACAWNERLAAQGLGASSGPRYQKLKRHGLGGSRRPSAG